MTQCLAGGRRETVRVPFDRARVELKFSGILKALSPDRLLVPARSRRPRTQAFHASAP
jgi:hypothetical protein